jgi:hypothetical protein
LVGSPLNPGSLAGTPDPVDPASRFLLIVLVWLVTELQVKQGAVGPIEPARSAA